MLKISKSINLSGYSVITQNGTDINVAYMTANLSTDGSSTANMSKNILNQELYNSNKAAVRKDMSDFETAVYAEEDKLTSGGQK